MKVKLVGFVVGLFEVGRRGERRGEKSRVILRVCGLGSSTCGVVGYETGIVRW